MNPPWQSKYTININTEMNYWPAEPTNLGECVEPLIAMVKDLTETGARTAKTMYGARGWVLHHNTDLWRATAPIDGPNWGMWPTGGAWLCQHLWDRYDFSGDKAYLAKVYPAMKGAAQFFLDTLVEEPKHKWLVTSPSLSPENGHPFGASVCAGPDDGHADPARPVRQLHPGGGDSRRRRGLPKASSPPRARGWRRTRSAAPASSRNGSRIGT